MVCGMDATYGDGNYWALCWPHQQEWEKIWFKVSSAKGKSLNDLLNKTNK